MRRWVSGLGLALIAAGAAAAETDEIEGKRCAFIVADGLPKPPGAAIVSVDTKPVPKPEAKGADLWRIEVTLKAGPLEGTYGATCGYTAKGDRFVSRVELVR